MLAYLLHLEGIDSIVVERRSRDYVLGRVRAGVIEHGTAQLLRDVGVGERMDAEGFIHDGVNLAFGGLLLRIDFRSLIDRYVVIYGQTQLQRDLYDVLDRAEIPLLDESDDVTLDGIEGTEPTVTFRRHGETHTIRCDYVAGCDGVHGVTPQYIPGSLRRTYERIYPFVWVGVLSPTPPVNDELIYANHETGFALCSMRNEHLSRYYVQGSADDSVDDWPDDRFWEELTTRLPPEAAGRLVTGPSIEKSIAPLRSFVAEPLQYGRLFLAGDAGHIVPPTGAKGLNLAFSDVHYLFEGLHDALTGAGTGALDAYSQRALRRVWHAVRFSWWMTTLMHRFPDTGDFDRHIQEAELDYLSMSEAAQRSFAEQYTGLPF